MSLITRLGKPAKAVFLAVEKPSAHGIWRIKVEWRLMHFYLP